MAYCIAKCRLHKATLATGLKYVYAVTVDRKGRILTEAGNNYRKTHPLQGRYDRTGKKPYLHAEVAAIAKAVRNRQKPYAIYIARVTNSGTGMAKPCCICELALLEAGITEVHFTF
jgi:tRNA(Arg) A34 adenosine deaminase TadA